MSEPFLSEMKAFSFPFAPKGWALCNGQLLPINQNQALFSLLGTTYGGNGQTTFALPNLQGRIPMHFGNGHTQGEQLGAAAVTVNTSQLPVHTHGVSATQKVADTAAPGNDLLLGATTNAYRPSAKDLVSLHAGSVTNVGGSQPHENRQPFLVLNWCIALQGIFPSQT